MPRSRKHHRSIPAHIDQSKLPKGIYWDKSGNGRWYVLEHPRKAVMVAGPVALLSDLHAIIEARTGGAERGTVGFVIQQFEASTEFAELAEGTRKGYQHQAKLVRDYRTPMGATLDTLQVARLGPAAIQRIVEAIAKGKPGVPGQPTKANHLLRYLRRTFAWGVRHGACSTNPAAGVRQAKERARFRMPTPEAFARLCAFAIERGNRKAHTAGSVAPYLGHLMVIAYTCRLRGIELVTLTDANATEAGILSNRRKGSRDNVTRWTPELRAAWDALLELRKAAYKRHSIDTVVPMLPRNRPLVVSQRGQALNKSSLDSAWQRLMDMATKSEDGQPPLLREDERFTLHGIKHRGITDSEDKASGGHKTEAMRQRYNHAVPTVEPAKLPLISGVISGDGEKSAKQDC
ncbi:site-specific integrase [Xanthomonas sacchari]|uniref:site-specific integrase n=1 Tax=Xanthomonas sacchari TaxID=56458 RepID=UPI00225017E3|nr:integrase [Xanthomonas sacchari]MCW0370228.1 Tyrosine recombinase XerC [Xanthomonas sacchari]